MSNRFWTRTINYSAVGLIAVGTVACSAQSPAAPSAASLLATSTASSILSTAQLVMSDARAELFRVGDDWRVRPHFTLRETGGKSHATIASVEFKVDTLGRGGVWTPGFPQYVVPASGELTPFDGPYPPYLEVSLGTSLTQAVGRLIVHYTDKDLRAGSAETQVAIAGVSTEKATLAISDFVATEFPVTNGMDYIPTFTISNTGEVDAWVTRIQFRLDTRKAPPFFTRRFIPAGGSIRIDKVGLEPEFEVGGGDIAKEITVILSYEDAQGRTGSVTQTNPVGH